MNNKENEKRLELNGLPKEIHLPGVDLSLATDEEVMIGSLRVRQLLEMDGDLIIVFTKFGDGANIIGHYSIQNTLKQCVKRMLADVFGITGSSALRNYKCKDDYIRLPILLKNEPTTIFAAKYSYLMAHKELCPEVVSEITVPTMTYTDWAVETIEEGEHAIIYENYQYPEENHTERFDSHLECQLAFDDICLQLQVGIDNPEYKGARVVFPHGRDLDGPYPSFGDVVLTFINEICTSKFTMLSNASDSQAA